MGEQRQSDLPFTLLLLWKVSVGPGLSKYCNNSTMGSMIGMLGNVVLVHVGVGVRWE